MALGVDAQWLLRGWKNFSECSLTMDASIPIPHVHGQQVIEQLLHRFRLIALQKQLPPISLSLHLTPRNHFLNYLLKNKCDLLVQDERFYLTLFDIYTN